MVVRFVGFLEVVVFRVCLGILDGLDKIDVVLFRLCNDDKVVEEKNIIV